MLIFIQVWLPFTNHLIAFETEIDCWPLGILKSIHTRRESIKCFSLRGNLHIVWNVLARFIPPTIHQKRFDDWGESTTISGISLTKAKLFLHKGFAGMFIPPNSAAPWVASRCTNSDYETANARASSNEFHFASSNCWFSLCFADSFSLVCGNHCTVLCTWHRKSLASVRRSTWLDETRTKT